MKTKIIKILILFFILISSLFIIQHSKRPIKCKILEVIEANEFYIDLNNNGVNDKNEHVKLKNIDAFTPIKTPYIEKISKELGISTEEYLKTGIIARTWAKENLKYKEILAYDTKDCFDNQICKIKIIYQNTDLAKSLLENGLAYIPGNIKSKEYIFNSNIKETKNIAKELSKLEFLFLNLKNKIVHLPNCEHVSKINKSELILKNKNLNSHIFCKKCLKEKLAQKITINLPKSKYLYKKSAYKKFNNIEIYLINPLEYSKPSTTCRSDYCKRLVNEINSAKNSIDIALYGFGEQKEIYDALTNAKNRGIKIRAVCDFDKDSDNSYYPLTKDFISEFGAICDKNPALMHNKFFIFDNNLVLTGSTNISSTGSGGYNSNLAIVIKDKNIAQIYKQEFEQMYNSRFSKYKKLNYIDFTNSILEIYFSPKGDIFQNAILPNIQKAKKSIYVSAFYLTDNEMIEELILAKNRGVEVLIILDATSASNFRKKVEKLRKAKIPTAIEDWGGKNHEKTIAIDDEILISGSCNFSKSGFYKNDENVIVIKNSNLTQFYQDYFLYLINSINKRFLIDFPHAEGLDSKNSCHDGIDNNYDGKIDKKDIYCIAQ